MNWEAADEARAAAIALNEKKKAARINAFSTKVNMMKEELPILKEIAKLLFEINENLKEK